eukprot:121639-Chlamydomonas_euryale.AAC.3
MVLSPCLSPCPCNRKESLQSTVRCEHTQMRCLCTSDVRSAPGPDATPSSPPSPKSIGNNVAMLAA